MSDVVVTVQDNTPQVTVTNNETAVVSIIQANPISLVPVDSQPKVIINTGVGGVYDTSTLLAMFAGILSLDEFSPSLKDDLLQLQSLWARIGTQVNLLTASDEVSIRQAAIDYTDENITLTVAAIDADTDGKISSAISVIDQKADEISLRVDSFEQDTEDNFTAYNTQLTANTNSIVASVLRLDAIDGPGGDVALLGSRVGITESSIEQEVTARQLTDGNLIETNSNLALAVDTINAAVTTFDEVKDRVTVTEAIIGPDGIVLSTMAQQFNFTISTIQSMLNNQWGVTIAESAGGIKYATGFKAILHPLWILSAAYKVDDTIFYDDKVYICIADHTASLTNNPSGVDAATYWDEIVGGEKTEFSVQADKFYVQVSGSETPIPVFTITEGVVSINGDLMISGVIQSTNYVATNNTSGATPAGFKIDSIAETFDMAGMTYDSTNGLSLTDPNNSITLQIGNMVDGDYCSISAGDISFYKYLASAHRLMKSLKRMETGVANTGITTVLPGYWETAPKITVSPYQLQCFNAAYYLQSQSLRLSAANIQETSSGSCRYQFTPMAELVLSSAAIGSSIGISTAGQTIRDAGYPSFSVTCTQYALGISGIKQVDAVVTGSGIEYYPGVAGGEYSYHQYFAIYVAVRLEYYNGAWQNTTGAFTAQQLSYDSPISWNLSTPVSIPDITHIRAVIQWVWTPTTTGIQLSYGTGCPEGTDPLERITVGLTSYTSNLAGFTTLAAGSLNWTAIG